MLKHWHLYVLSLQDNKWYIGISTNVDARFRQHQKGFASAAWTKLHKPIAIHYRKDLGICEKSRAERYESRVTRKYMQKYDLNNVRGGDIRSPEEMIARFGRIYNKEG